MTDNTHTIIIDRSYLDLVNSGGDPFGTGMMTINADGDIYATNGIDEGGGPTWHIVTPLPLGYKDTLLRRLWRWLTRRSLPFDPVAVEITTVYMWE